MLIVDYSDCKLDDSTTVF